MSENDILEASARLEKAAAEGKEERKQGLVKRAIVEELQEKAQEALKLKRLRDGAKTDTKRKYYEKKLKENNEDVPDLLLALDRMVKIEEARDGSSDAEGEAPSESAGAQEGTELSTAD